jgi:glutathione S-transferase|eukprot:COSAG06_NODE_13158_length_1287_cov_4.127946_1_plen_245_part_00
MVEGLPEVVYYANPARAESVRLLLTIGGHSFTDTLLPDIPAQAASLRWGAVPNLRLANGQVLGQTQAILRYVGRSVALGGVPLTPEDPVQCALVDEALAFVADDLWRRMAPSDLGLGWIPPDKLTSVATDAGPEAEAIAEELMAPGGRLHTMLDALESNIGGSDSVLSTGALSTADVLIFTALGWFAAGFMTTKVNPSTLLGGRPKLTALVGRVGALPQVREYYDSAPKRKLIMTHVYREWAKL